MNKTTTILILVATVAAYLFGVSCKNPFKDEKKKELVRVLMNDYLVDVGRYIYYWDGKDKNGKYITPGRYIYLMEVKDFQDQDYVTAQAGGKIGANNQEHFETGFWNSFQIEPAYPNPFKIQEGVNIPFLVSRPATVKISIFKD